MNEDEKQKGEELYDGIMCIPGWEFICKCGRYLDAEWEYCPYCGHKLWQDKEEQ